MAAQPGILDRAAPVSRHRSRRQGVCVWLSCGAARHPALRATLTDSGARRTIEIGGFSRRAWTFLDRAWGSPPPLASPKFRTASLHHRNHAACASLLRDRLRRRGKGTRRSRPAIAHGSGGPIAGDGQVRASDRIALQPLI
jgi:hypothetical protein